MTKSGKHVNGRWVALVALALVTVATMATPVPPAGAVPTGIAFDRVTPIDGNNILVARTAANNPENVPTWQLKADLYFTNSSSTDRSISSVEISYPGSSQSSFTYTPLRFPDGVASQWVIDDEEDGRVPVYDGLQRDLPFPLPPQVRFRVFFGTDPTPIQRTYGLAVRDNGVPGGAMFFPANASDLAAGQYWHFGTRHIVDSGGGTGGAINPSTQGQRHGLDMGVVRWDTSTNSWSSVRAGAPADVDDRVNSDYLAYNKPLYAMADGVVTSCYRGEADHQPVSDFDDATWEDSSGNHLIIRYGNNSVLLAHNKDGSIPTALCPNDGQNDNLSIPVTAGQFIGRVGNTGRTTWAHIHAHATHFPGEGVTNTQSGVPLNFLNIRTAADQTSIDNLGQNPTLRRHDRLAMHRHSLILPNPCGFAPPGAGSAEASYHGISEGCYPDVYNMAVAKGYRPTFIDGYKVGSSTFFNVIFRAAGVPYYHYYNLTQGTYETLLGDMEDAGFRVHNVDSYFVGSSVRYAVIFEQRPGPLFDEFHALTDAQFNAEFDRLGDLGYEPVNVSGVQTGSGMRWTGLFERLSTTGWTLESVPASSFQATVNTNLTAGRRVTYVNGFAFSGTPYITGIFMSPMGTTASDEQLTGTGYQTVYDDQTGAGRFTRAVTGYDNGSGSHRFAGVWRGRPNTSITSGPSGNTTSRTASFAFSGNTPFVTRFQCARERTTYTTCTSPKTYTNVPIGAHSFRVRAYDREGLVDTSPASRSWTVLGRISGG